MTIAIEISRNGIGRLIVTAKNVAEQARAHEFLADAAPALDELDRKLRTARRPLAPNVSALSASKI